MPQLGYDMQEGTVVRWRKKEGEAIERGEVLAEIETDKAVVEMEAIEGGIVGKLLVDEGTTVQVSGAIAIITAPGEAVPDVAPPAAEAKETTAPAPPAEEPAPASTGPATPAGGRIKASPIARRLAKESGVDLSLVKGSGPGGRITEGDVRTFSESQAKPTPATAATATPSGEPQRIKLSRMRLAIGRRTAESKRQAPHFYVSISVDMGKAMELRKRLNTSLGDKGRITVNDMVVKAAAQALSGFPNLNSTFEEGHILVHPDVNIGIGPEQDPASDITGR
jgi:pyruvate dehydrogenase E2 component (dihydrolipoamide acetyltransferase)